MQTPSLKSVQTIAKVAKIISQIVRIFSIIGCVGCIIGLISVAIGSAASFQIGDVTIHSLVEEQTEESINTLYTQLVSSAILCFGTVFLSKFFITYFKNEQEAGTPFTQKGADEIFQLGIKAIVIPIASKILALCVALVMKWLMDDVTLPDTDEYFSLGLGITLLILSFLFRYGAELRGEAKEDSKDSKRDI